jgi:threonine aldolase
VPGCFLALKAHLAEQGVVVGGGASGAMRFVLHKDVDDAALQTAISGFQSFQA